MTKLALISASLTAVLVTLLPARPAQALNYVSFVSSTGSGTLCSRVNPCASLQLAQNATLAGGEINCLDSGPIEGGVISKSITIDCGGAAASTFPIFIGGAGVVVKIRNLIFPSFGSEGFGIWFSNGAALIIENCVFHDFTASPAMGIKFQPSSSAQLVVTDSTFASNGSGFTGGGIVIAPASGMTAKVALNRVTVTNNSHGIVADGTGGGSIRGVVTDSVVSGNANNGITVSTSGVGAAVLSIQNTKVSGNNIGLVAGGSNAGLLVSQSNISLNNTGLFTTGGGVLLSYKDNKVNGNTTTDGTFTGSVGQQ